MTFRLIIAALTGALWALFTNVYDLSFFPSFLGALSLGIVIGLLPMKGDK